MSRKFPIIFAMVLCSAIGALLLPSPASAAWMGKDIIDPVTDAHRGLRYVDSANGSSLVLKCDTNGPGTVYVNIISKEYLGGRGASTAFRNLTYRFDGNPAVEARWAYDGNNAVLIQKLEGYVGFISGLATAKRLIIRAERYDGELIDIAFDVTGAAAALESVYRACGDQTPSGQFTAQ